MGRRETLLSTVRRCLLAALSAFPVQFLSRQSDFFLFRARAFFLRRARRSILSSLDGALRSERSDRDRVAMMPSAVRTTRQRRRG